MNDGPQRLVGDVYEADEAAETEIYEGDLATKGAGGPVVADAAVAIAERATRVSEVVDRLEVAPVDAKGLDPRRTAGRSPDRSRGGA